MISTQQQAQGGSARRRVLALMLISTAVIVIAYAVYSSLLLTKNVSSTKLSSLTSLSSGPLQGQTLPSFSLANLETDTQAVTSASLQGHPAVVNFFASWCTPCQAETPMLAKFASQHKGLVRFIGIDEADSRGAARRFVLRARVRYAVGFDPSKTLASSFDLVGLPTTLFVAANGRVSAEAIGQLTASSLARDYQKVAGSAR